MNAATRRPNTEEIVIARHLLIANGAYLGTIVVAAAAHRPGEDHDLVLLGAREPGIELVEEYARHLGIVPTTLAAAAHRAYESVLVHSFAHWADLPGMLETLPAAHVDYYADGLRNELRFRPPHPGIGTARSLVYFGYALHNDLVSAQLGAVDHRVVSLDQFAAFWQWLAGAHPSPGPRVADVLRPDDVLVAMRYWGRSRMYPTPSALTVADVLGGLDLPAGTRRLVVRPDPRSLVDFSRILARIREVVPPDIDVATWADVVGYDTTLGSLDVLDRFVFNESWNLGGFFGYDGTPNYLVAATQPATRILWPSAELLRDAIVDPTAAAAAVETVRIQRSAVEQIAHGVQVPEVRTSGSGAAAVLDRIDPQQHAGTSDWTRSESEAVLLAVLDVVGLDESAEASEVIARLRGLFADRVHFERLLREHLAATNPAAGEREQGEGT